MESVCSTWTCCDLWVFVVGYSPAPRLLVPRLSRCIWQTLAWNLLHCLLKTQQKRLVLAAFQSFFCNYVKDYMNKRNEAWFDLLHLSNFQPHGGIFVSNPPESLWTSFRTGCWEEVWWVSLITTRIKNKT